MPVVTVNLLTGRTQEQKRAVVEGITKVLEGVGVPAQATHVIIQEVPREHWAVGGKLFSDK